ncbi:MAG TPA: hypothetical protein PKL77_10905 [Candidatus Omnitrophota bacterium]|nr:hypothetical protein [Candidatus Omnitrophota bacterium]
MEYYTIWKGEIPIGDPGDCDRAFFKCYPEEKNYVRHVIGEEETKMFPEGYVLVTNVGEGVRVKRGFTVATEPIGVQ